MRIKVLVVDDSSFIRHRITDFLSEDKRIDIIGVAEDGYEAIEKARTLRPDLITMDVQMPKMNGIEAVRVIMRECPTNILMLSSLTSEGAAVTLQALEAGALDFIPKDLRSWMGDSGSIGRQLCDKIVALGKSSRGGARVNIGSAPRDGRQAPSRASESKTSTLQTRTPRSAIPDKPQPAAPLKTIASGQAPKRGVTPPVAAAQPGGSKPSKAAIPANCRLVVIGTSTGGPAALQEILMQLPGNFPYPILLVQHMPKTFTSVFAQRLNQQCDIQVKEAEDGDQLQPGCALLAPGGHQMIVDQRQRQVRIMPGDERLTYKPSVDVTYASVAKSYGASALAIILTGMGADGRDGAKLLQQKGATIWAQNKESCTIFGMPQAVINAGLADEILDLTEFGPVLRKHRAR